MRRYAFFILFLIVLATPLVISAVLGVRSRHGAGGDEPELVIITPHQEGIRREFAEAFSAWRREHFGQGVNIDYRTFGASDIVKYFEAGRDTVFKSQGTYKVDLVWGGGDYTFDVQLKKPGYLEPVRLDERIVKAAFPQPTLAGLALYDPDKTAAPSWYGTALSSFGIVYNKDVVRYLGLPEPKTWRDLADPRYRGWIVLADPTRSASAKQAYMVMAERAMVEAAKQGRSEDEGWAEGMGLVRQICANARLFVDASSVVPIMVGSGDAGAGTAIDFYGRSQADAVGDARMGYVEPAGATVINPDPIALVRGAEHRDLAICFMEFVLSEQGQRLWNTRPGLPGGPRQTALRRLPIRPDVYEKHLADFTDKVNPYAISGGFNKSLTRERTFAILGELMQAGCIDLLDELRETRKAILASPHAAELDAKLGRFPFGENEAMRRLAGWKSATSAGRLELMRKWTGEFREEYRKLRQEAAR